MKLYVGTSAFSVKEWKGSFYPAKIPTDEMLAYYAARFCAVEINNTFYRAPTAALLESWAVRVPDSFRFTLKAPQAITHFKRLNACEEETKSFVATARTLGNRLGAILFQLPPNLKKDLSRLESFLRLLPADVRVAFEFRHLSWLEEDSLDLLRVHGRALCVSDTDGSEAQIVKSASWGYLRLRRTEYCRADLLDWIARIYLQGWAEVYVFFKHEDSGTGPKLAQQFVELAASQSLE
jgi:uncharacterized protein YecE (DUF72 family)